jgi:putative redox protein
MAEDLLPPNIDDPHRRQIGTRNVRARNLAGSRTEIYLRQFPPLVTDEPKHRNGTDTAPTPLETVLGALCGCKGATIFYVAEAMRFDYAGVEFEGSSVVDLRGPRGVPGVRPYYESVDLKITLYTDEPESRINQLTRNVEFRCPVMNLLRSADVKLTVEWETRPASQAPQAEPAR